MMKHFLKKTSIVLSSILIGFYASANDARVSEQTKENIPNYLASESYSIFISETDNNIPTYKPVKNTSCKEQMFASVIINNSQSSLEHSFIIPSYIYWINPQGTVQEKTQVNLPIYKGKGKTYAWLKLHQPSGAAMLGFIDDTLGLEKFIGQWTIELHIDGKEVTSYSFQVLC